MEKIRRYDKLRQAQTISQNINEGEEGEKVETHNGNVFDAEVRKRIGCGNRNRGEWGPQDAKQQSHIGPLTGGGGGNRRCPGERTLHPVSPPSFTSGIFSISAIRTLLQRRQSFRRPQAPRSRKEQLGRRGMVLLPAAKQTRHGRCRPRRTLGPRPCGRQPSDNLFFKRRKEPLLPLHLTRSSSRYI